MLRVAGYRIKDKGTRIKDELRNPGNQKYWNVGIMINIVASYGLQVIGLLGLQHYIESVHK